MAGMPCGHGGPGGHGALALDRSSVWEAAADSHVTRIEAPGLGGAKPCKAARGNGHAACYAKAANPAQGGRKWPMEGGGPLKPE